MRKLIFPFSPEDNGFYPICLTRSVLDLKAGILSIREKWDRLASEQGVELSFSKENWQELKVSDELWIPSSTTDLTLLTQKNPINNGCIQIKRPWDIFSFLAQLITNDISWISNDFPIKSKADHVLHFGDFPLFLHENCKIEPCSINTSEGPVMIDDGALVMQGAQLRGPLYIGKNAVVKMGAKLYAGTSIGNNCIVGGEVKNSIFHANANKAHHGYIGDSYIGEFCNLGAGTSCSNLKNTAGKIKAWNMQTGQFESATEKLGVIMGDHVRTAIHSGFNSGTVIGPFSNIFNLNGLSPKFIPAFTWGGENFQRYHLDNLIRDVQRWEAMKGSIPSSESIEMIKNLYAKL